MKFFRRPADHVAACSQLQDQYWVCLELRGGDNRSKFEQEGSST